MQSILYLPHFMSWVIVVALFQQMLGGTGLINNYLRATAYDPMHIIGNVEAFQCLLTSQVIWKDTGWATILFLAALSQIDSQLYEASAWTARAAGGRLWHVTLPGSAPIIILLLILQLGDSLTVGFEQIILQQQAVGARRQRGARHLRLQQRHPRRRLGRRGRGRPGEGRRRRSPSCWRPTSSPTSSASKGCTSDEHLRSRRSAAGRSAGMPMPGLTDRGRQGDLS